MNRQELLTKLAFELPEWPHNKVRGAAQRCGDYSPFFWSFGADGWCLRMQEELITRSDWLAEIKRVAVQPEAPEWGGEGLPPVGVECEVTAAEYNGKWLKMRVTAVTDDFVVGYIRDDRESPVCHKDPTVEFRPIRSEEDVAVDEMSRIAEGDTPGFPTVDTILRRLYRAGYHKKEED